MRRGQRHGTHIFAAFTNQLENIVNAGKWHTWVGKRNGRAKLPLSQKRDRTEKLPLSQKRDRTEKLRLSHTVIAMYEINVLAAR
jgi:hypothetical protein